MQIAGRILNRKYEKAGRDVNVLISPNSDVYNPTFEEKIELREPNMSATSTILLKVINEVTIIIAPSLPNPSRFALHHGLFQIYTIDKFYKRSMLIGFASLNIFVALGTNKQPSVDAGGVQVSYISYASEF